MESERLRTIKVQRGEHAPRPRVSNKWVCLSLRLGTLFGVGLEGNQQDIGHHLFGNMSPSLRHNSCDVFFFLLFVFFLSGGVKPWESA